MEISNELKKFIKDHVIEFDNNKFAELYYELWLNKGRYGIKDRTDFLTILNQIGVPKLNYTQQNLQDDVNEIARNFIKVFKKDFKILDYSLEDNIIFIELSDPEFQLHDCLADSFYGKWREFDNWFGGLFNYRLLFNSIDTNWNSTCEIYKIKLNPAVYKN